MQEQQVGKGCGLRELGPHDQQINAHICYRGMSTKKTKGSGSCKILNHIPNFALMESCETLELIRARFVLTNKRKLANKRVICAFVAISAYAY